MTFRDFIKNKLFGKDEYTVKSKDITEFIEKREASKYYLTEIALFTAIDLIARTLSKCEFVTVRNGKEYRGAEYYLWNYKPNKHQTKAEFVVQLISTLIFRNEVLVFETSDRQLLIADNFGLQENAVTDDIFTNVFSRGWTSPRTYRSSDVLYLKLNSFSLSNLLSNMCATYQRLMNSADERYNKAVGHKGILTISTSATGTQDFQKRYNELLNERFVDYFNKKNAVLPLFQGFNYSEPSTEAGKTTNSEINDLQKLRQEAFAIVGNALHIAPALLSGDASMLKDATDAFISNAVDPYASSLEQEITVKRYGENDFLSGNYMFIDTTYARHMDAISNAVNVDKAIAAGVLSPAKAQRYCGMLPTTEEWAQDFYMTKNYQSAELSLKGGENDENQQI